MFFSLIVGLLSFIAFSFPWVVKQWKLMKANNVAKILKCFLLIKYILLLLGLLVLTYIFTFFILGSMGLLSH
ncbi:hypothetical protein IGI49_003880 [Enterococcus sp. AZ071]